MHKPLLSITAPVIDKSGNPIPNAIVEAKDGAEYVTTEADGSFTIEVPVWLKALKAKYSGFGEKTFNLGNSPYALIVLSKRESKWFINAVYSLTIPNEKKILNNIGLMGGRLGNWGGYAKILMPIYNNGTWKHPTIAVGVIKKVDPIYLYIGAGYTGWCDYSYFYEGWYASGNLMFDGGVIYRIRDFNINLGYSYSSKYGNTNNSIQLSAGYCF